jgi:hypothetical protein
MSGKRNPRLVVPALMASIGTVIAIATWIGDDWSGALGVELVTVVTTLAYYILGARDSDLGALFGSRPDERQVTISMRATLLAANALAVTAIGGVIITTAMGDLVWPFLLFGAVGGLTYFAGLAYYRHR